MINRARYDPLGTQFDQSRIIGKPIDTVDHQLGDMWNLIENVIFVGAYQAGEIDVAVVELQFVPFPQ